MSKFLKFKREVGIIGYGVYVLMYRIKVEEIGRVWGVSSFLIQEKFVFGFDEDMIIIGIEVVRNVFKRVQIDFKFIRVIWFGIESKFYVVKLSGMVIVEVIGVMLDLDVVDFEFVCKVGIEVIQVVIGFVGLGMVDYVMVIGVDILQGRFGDYFEFMVVVGGVVYIFVLKSFEILVYFEVSYLYVIDIFDFWRRQYEYYLRYGNCFIGEFVYFYQIINVVKIFMEEFGYMLNDFDYVVFYQLNVKFLFIVVKIFGFLKEKVFLGFFSGIIGNIYSGVIFVGVLVVFDIVKFGDRILWVSFGLGVGSDVFSFVVQDVIEEKRDLVLKIMDYVNRKKYIDYVFYVKYRGKYIL